MMANVGVGPLFAFLMTYPKAQRLTTNLGVGSVHAKYYA